jgi:hypothetical protein
MTNVHVNKMTPAALAVAAAMALALTGCSAGPAPLKGAPAGEGVCYPSRPHGRMTYGLETFTNHSSQTVFFDRVGLRDPVHLKVLGAYIAPRNRSVPAGVVTGWPPEPQPGPTEWAQRRPVRGYQLRPGATAEVILGFELTALPGGQSPGLLIWYHTSGVSYQLRDDLAISVRKACH